MRKKQQIDMSAFDRVVGVFVSITSHNDMRKFLNELLTAGEMRDITLRWMLLERLVAGVTQRKISQDLKISLCKITRGSKILKQTGSVAARVIEAGRAALAENSSRQCAGARVRAKRRADKRD